VLDSTYSLKSPLRQYSSDLLGCAGLFSHAQYVHEITSKVCGKVYEACRSQFWSRREFPDQKFQSHRDDISTAIMSGLSQILKSLRQIQYLGPSIERINENSQRNKNLTYRDLQFLFSICRLALQRRRNIVKQIFVGRIRTLKINSVVFRLFSMIFLQVMISCIYF
jgi:hypothetical protein